MEMLAKEEAEILKISPSKIKSSITPSKMISIGLSLERAQLSFPERLHSSLHLILFH
jgi:hypothetical protein